MSTACGLAGTSDLPPLHTRTHVTHTRTAHITHTHTHTHTLHTHVTHTRTHTSHTHARARTHTHTRHTHTSHTRHTHTHAHVTHTQTHTHTHTQRTVPCSRTPQDHHAIGAAHLCARHHARSPARATTAQQRARLECSGCIGCESNRTRVFRRDYRAAWDYAVTAPRPQAGAADRHRVEGACLSNAAACMHGWCGGCMLRTRARTSGHAPPITMPSMMAR
jgi:hypothetical protein